MVGKQVRFQLTQAIRLALLRLDQVYVLLKSAENKYARDLTSEFQKIQCELEDLLRKLLEEEIA